MIKFDFDNTYAKTLEGFYTPWQGAVAPDPKIIQFNQLLTRDLGLDPEALNTQEGAAIFSGSIAPEGADPLAQAYAGHQFGGFSQQLGDGRALLLGEVLDKDGNRFDLQLKGSGRTPFSRGGDGKAVLGPVLREYLMGEAMHALRVPTTRALAAVTTGEDVMRDGLKPGAVLARIASSHLRVGTFQFFAARQDWDKVRQLADYAIARHYPDLVSADDKYLRFLGAVVDRQATLIAKWMHVGFIHGVMNTDNMTISGETIDYGPCAFLDSYDPATVFSSIDRNGRYAFGNQPNIALWNLTRLAETLLQLIDAKDDDNAISLATDALNGFNDRYNDAWTTGMRAKIGLMTTQEGDTDLLSDLLEIMTEQRVDYTQFFRALADAATGDDTKLLTLLTDPAKIAPWLATWQIRLQSELQNPTERAAAMNKINPIYIPRNHRVEETLQAAEAGDFVPFTKLLDVLQTPFTKRAGLENYEGPAPKDAPMYQTFCGT